MRTPTARSGWPTGPRCTSCHRYAPGSASGGSQGDDRWAQQLPHHSGALDATTGELVRTVRERCRVDDVLAAVEALGTVHPDVPKLLVWDNAPPHAAPGAGRGPGCRHRPRDPSVLRLRSWLIAR